MTEFQNGIVAGTGTLALFCALRLRDAGLPVTVCDMDQGTSGFLKRRVEREGLAYEHPEPKELFARLEKADVPTLLVSAINPYIVPGRTLKNPCITAINCHQALLPEHPGRNAEMWAIYEGDEKTGITWHILTAQVDGGNILVQKEMAITDRHTAYHVFREQIGLAQEAFEELLPDLLEGNAASIPQGHREDRKLHYSWEVPNEGVLDTDWSGAQISRFLRAMDYSILDVVPRPVIQTEEGRRSIRKYRITEAQSLEEGFWTEGERIYIRKPGMLFELS